MSPIARSIATAAAALLIAISVLLLSQVVAAEYPMFHLNPERTGNVSGDAPVTGNLLWKADVGCFINGGASIANGRVYVANRIGGSGTLGLYCLNETTGEVIWYNPIGGSGGVSTPAISGDRLFVGSLTGDLTCVNASDGDTIWNRAIEPKPLYWGVGSCPLLYGDAVFVNTASDGALFAFDFDGNELWNITTGNYGGYSPAVAYYISPAAHDGKIFWGSGHALYCVDVPTQTEVWNFSTSDTVSTVPAIEGGVVYFATMSRMYAVDMDGNEVWRRGLEGTISSPAVAYGRVYIGSDDRKMYCVNASDGGEIWTIPVGANVKSSPVVADETVYFGTNIDGDMVYALNATDGSVRWTYDTGNCIMAQPAVSDGILFIGSDSGYLYAFRDPPLKGDLNHDLAVTAADAALALRMAVGAVPATDAADVSGDGVMTSLDALMILQVAAGNVGI